VEELFLQAIQAAWV